MHRLDDYGAFLASGFDHLLDDEPRLIYGIIRQIRDIKVGVAGINSAWSCARNGEKGKLWLGGHWQIQTLHNKIVDADIKIALIHHPLNWFVEMEDPSINPEIERSFHFLLHGHEHQNWVSSSGSHHVRIAAGACYGSSEKESGYSFVRLNLDNGTGEIWMRHYDELGGGWIPRVIHNRTNDKGIWHLANMEFRSQTKSHKKLNKSVDYLIAPPAVDSPESRGVFGRGSDIAKVVQALQNKHLVILYGMSGIGKSRLIQELQHTAVFRQFGYYRFITYPYMKFDDLYRHLAPILGCVEEDPTLPLKLFGRLDFSELIRFATKSDPTIIHLDRAHHLFDEQRFHDLDIRSLLLEIIEHAPQIRLVLESREAPPQDLFPGASFQIIRVNGIDREGVRAFFKYPFPNDWSKGWALSDEDVNIVYTRMGGNDQRVHAHPLGLMLLSQVSDGLRTDPVEVLKRHNQTLLGELEESLFADLYENVLKESERRMLRICALYRNRIPDLHVDRLNALVSDSGAFDHLIRRCILNSSEGQESYILHNIISDLTLRHIDQSSQEFWENHECIAEAWLSRLKGTHRPSLPNILAASESVYHLTMAGRFDLLESIPHRLMRQGDVIAHLFTISNQLFQSSRSIENKQVLELLIAIAPTNDRAHRYLGREIERLEGKGNGKALKHYEEAYRLGSKYPPNLSFLGHCLIARKTPQRFIEITNAFDQRTYRQVMDERNFHILSMCFSLIGEDIKASAIRRSQIELGSHYVSFYNSEADYLRRSGKLGEAMFMIDQAEKLRIANDNTMLGRALILENLGQGEGASNLRQAKIASGTRNVSFYAAEIKYFKKERKIDDILRILDQAEELGIDNEYIILTRSRALGWRGNEQEASRLRRSQIELGTNNVGFYDDEVRHLVSQQRFDDAMEILEQAEKSKVSTAHVVWMRSNVLAWRGYEEDASQLRQTQVKAGSSYPAFYRDEASYLRKRGRYNDALLVLDQAEQAGISSQLFSEMRHNIILQNKGQAAIDRDIIDLSDTDLLDELPDLE